MKAIAIQGDVMQPETLLPACAGVDVVVCAISNSDAIASRQKNLIAVAKQTAWR